MNDLSALLLRPIELVSEPPFPLGTGMVHPASLEVVWPDGSCKLEPRVMQVLVALNRRRGEPLSREELSRLCWDGRVVGDDALVRCIMKLRKAFQRDAAVEIGSIPKVGYRLRLLSVAPEPAALPSSKRRPSRWLLASGGVVALAVLGACAFVLMKPPGAIATEAVRPLTSDPGVETHPAWSPDGRRIAFVRRISGAPCEILVAPVPQGEAKVVGRCSVESMTRLAWTRGGEILLSDRPTREAVRRIRALAPDTGRIREVTAPPTTSLGDVDPVVTHRGDHLVFRRAFSYGVGDLYTAEVSGAGERPLTRDGWKALGYAFAADDRTLVFSSNRGGASGLWSVDYRRPATPVRLSLGLLEFGRLSADRNGLLAAEAGDYRSNLFAWRAGAAPVALTNGNSSDWDPDLSSTGQLAFVSDQ